MRRTAVMVGIVMLVAACSSSSTSQQRAAYAADCAAARAAVAAWQAGGSNIALDDALAVPKAQATTSLARWPDEAGFGQLVVAIDVVQHEALSGQQNVGSPRIGVDTGGVTSECGLLAPLP